MRAWSTTGRWRRAAVAALVAYALVAQALLLSFAGAQHAAVAHDATAVVCQQKGGAGSDPSPAAAHEGLCCVLGCGVAAPAGPAPAVAALERPTPAMVAMLPGWGHSAHPVTSNVLPVGSRAPPRLG